MGALIAVRALQTRSDTELVASARSGNEYAFEALVRRYRRPLLAYARRLLGSDSRAEDVLQQALLQAWVALRTDAEVTEVRPWLFRIVHNTAVSTLRRPQHEYVELNEALDAEAHGQDAESRLAVSQALASLAELPELQRRAIVMTAFAGSSHEEVASTLGLSDGSVRGLIHRGRATLRAAAAALLPIPVANWLVNRSSRRPPMTARVSEGIAGAGSAGAGGMLLKGAAIVATAGAIAGAGGALIPQLLTSHSHGTGGSAAANRAQGGQPVQPSSVSAPLGRQGAAASSAGVALGSTLSRAVSQAGSAGRLDSVTGVFGIPPLVTPRVDAGGRHIGGSAIFATLLLPPLSAPGGSGGVQAPASSPSGQAPVTPAGQPPVTPAGQPPSTSTGQPAGGGTSGQTGSPAPTGSGWSRGHHERRIYYRRRESPGTSHHFGYRHSPTSSGHSPTNRDQRTTGTGQGPTRSTHWHHSGHHGGVPGTGGTPGTGGAPGNRGGWGGGRGSGSGGSGGGRGPGSGHSGGPGWGSGHHGSSGSGPGGQQGGDSHWGHSGRA